MLANAYNKFKTLTKHPEQFLQNQDEVVEDVRHLLKDVYDFMKNQEPHGRKAGVLPKLIIKDFDDEQIWQELELQNASKYDTFIEDVPRLLALKEKLCFQLLDEDCEKTVVEEESDTEEHDLPLCKETVKSKVYETERKAGKFREPSVVDDRFFKFSEMEEFLNAEDRRESENVKNHINNDSDSEGSINLFENIPSEDDEMDEKGVHYEEFFDEPEDVDSQENATAHEKTNSAQVNEGDSHGNELSDFKGENERLHSKKNEKQVRFDLFPGDVMDSGGEHSEDKNGGSQDEEEKHLQSSFDARQERIHERIKSLEEKALAEKPWQLAGEVSASTRPQNSLLEEVLEYDLSSRPAPVITQQTTMKLEDIIRQRIKDKVWDDVERKVKPTIAPDEYKKKLVMDHEKSKLSLAQIYEQEYLHQKESQDPSAEEKPEEEPKEHHEIRSMASSLFAKLDALTNFHYTPKPVIPDVKIVSNIPAITMEEVAPVGTSDATLLAPEEVKAKQKRELISKKERTETDKKRERRMKKKQQRIKKVEQEKREKLVKKLRPGLGNKYSKEKALKTLEKLSNEKNVYQLEDEGKDKGVRSSTAFFNRLQEEVEGYAKGRSNAQQKKEKGNDISAKRIKL